MAVQIELYYPGKVDLKISFPTAWNDLSEQELRFIAKQLLSAASPDDVLPVVLRHLLEKRITKEAVRLLSAINPGQVASDVLPLLDFILKENDRTNTPAPVQFGGVNFICNPFDEITCGEFEDTEITADAFNEDPKAEHLARMAAILFRKRNTEYIRYLHRTDNYLTYSVEAHIHRFVKLPPEQLYAIFIWYAGCRGQLKLLFPALYEGGKKNDRPDPMIFTKTIHAGAGPKNGNRMQIRRMKLYEFLFDCNQEAIKAKEIEAQYNK